MLALVIKVEARSHAPTSELEQCLKHYQATATGDPSIDLPRVYAVMSEYADIVGLSFELRFEEGGAVMGEQDTGMADDLTP